jgi:hypothetical protein
MSVTDSSPILTKKEVWRGWNTPTPYLFCLALQGVFHFKHGSSFIQFWPCFAGVALAPPTGSSATVSDGSGSVCQHSGSSYDDGAADGTTGLAGHKVRALVRGEAAFGASVPARSADNGPGIHMAKTVVA